MSRTTSEEDLGGSGSDDVRSDDVKSDDKSEEDARSRLVRSGSSVHEPGLSRHNFFRCVCVCDCVCVCVCVHACASLH